MVYSCSLLYGERGLTLEGKLFFQFFNFLPPISSCYDHSILQKMVKLSSPSPYAVSSPTFQQSFWLYVGVLLFLKCMLLITGRLYGVYMVQIYSIGCLKTGEQKRILKNHSRYHNLYLVHNFYCHLGTHSNVITHDLELRIRGPDDRY